jgi:hypothetical protein
MLIAIDYDDTYTRDPEWWSAVIGFGVKRGHRFVCVTGRNEPPDPIREPPLPSGVPVVCSAGKLKDPAARRAGFHVDVWIDDMPGLIKGSQMLEGLEDICTPTPPTEATP